MNDRAKQLLEQGLEKARNKYVTRKKREKMVQMHHWQKDTQTSWVLRDYKTYFLYIVKNKQGKFQCSFSGAKMSVYSSKSDVYDNLKQAKTSMIEFIDQYDHKLNPIDSE